MFFNLEVVYLYVLHLKNRVLSRRRYGRIFSISLFSRILVFLVAEVALEIKDAVKGSPRSFLAIVCFYLKLLVSQRLSVWHTAILQNSEIGVGGWIMAHIRAERCGCLARKGRQFLSVPGLLFNPSLVRRDGELAALKTMAGSISTPGKAVCRLRACSLRLTFTLSVSHDPVSESAEFSKGLWKGLWYSWWVSLRGHLWNWNTSGCSNT